MEGSHNMKTTLPTLNFDDFISGVRSKKSAFVSALKEALETKGFFFLKNHWIKPKTLSLAREAFDIFFNLPEEVRLKYEYSEEKHQRGYTPLKIEKGEYAKIADEKHFFQIGIDRNVDVEEIPQFKLACDKLFKEFRGESRIMLNAISLSLGLREFYFSSKEGNSILRAIEYPATENPLVDDGIAAAGGNIIGMCASKHTDINMLTLLLAQEEGLQLWHDGAWLPITINSPDLIIVNAGDMLEHLTGGRYKSGLHRVVCQKNVRRFSIPFFCHLNTNESVVPLDNLGESDLAKYHFRTAGEFLDYRLNQIGL